MKVAIEHGLWSEEKDLEISETRAELNSLNDILDGGGIELDEAIEIARKMRKLRAELMINNLILEEIKSQSANRKAENAKVEYFISRCTLTDKGTQVYKDLDDFYLRQNEDMAQLATYAFNKLWYNYNEDMFLFPEDKFMKEFNVDDEEVVEKKERKPFLKNGKPIKPKVVKETAKEAEAVEA